MEGIMNGARLTLTRPTPRSVAPRANSSSNIQQPETAAPITAPAVVSAPVITSQQAAAVTAETPRFSQLTPIYQPTPTNTPADIAQPRVKGIEFVKPTVAKSTVVVRPVELPVNMAVVESLSTPESVVDEPVTDVHAQQFEYVENNLEAIDLDQMEGIVGGAGTQSVTLEPIVAAEIALQPAMDTPAPDFIHQYFQQNTADHASKIGKLKEFHKAAKAKVVAKMPPVKHVKRFGFASVLVAVIAVGGYIVADSFFINQQAKEVLALETKPAATPVLNEDNTTTTETPAAEDTSAQQLAQNSQQVSAPTTHSGYVVAADQPKVLKIPKLGIHASIVSLGLTSNGAVDTPKNIWNAGWYNGSAKPGTDGAAFIDGHSSASRGALFGNLDKLVAGDQIQVERGDGSLITYRVAYTVTVDRNAVDMASMMKPYGGAARGLNIITCVGRWIDSEKTLENRALVYAQQM